LDTSLLIHLPQDYNREQIETLLVDNYQFMMEEPISVECVFYDTFDWLLFNKNLALHQTDQWLYLRNIGDGEQLERLSITAPPKFPVDLPESPLRDHVKSIIEPRALLNLCELTLRSYTYRILNRDKKTVVRLNYTEWYLSSDTSSRAAFNYLNLLPVRGYPKYTQSLVNYLKKGGFAFSHWEDLYFRALVAVGQHPGSYSSKIDVQLEPDMRSDEATKIILRSLLRVMRANQSFIQADIDTEFLHDYRVAIRRTRSALSQIKGVFPGDVVQRFKQDFRYIGQLTNELRDLDVYLLSEEKYKSMLPDILRDDIEPLFDYLRAKRENTLAQVVSSLDSQKIERILLDWEEFLNEPAPETPQAVHALTPIIELAQKRIYKHYRRVIKDGKDILKDPQDELMHALRIECKKLRYLIEFFSSLFPTENIGQLISQLKQLQDNLGDFNDLSVQQEYLLKIAEDLPIDDTKSRRALLATGSLVESLANQQQLVRDSFAKTFTNFASTENQELYEQLFSTKGGGSIL
jgi:CHAD domain-containing protein